MRKAQVLNYIVGGFFLLGVSGCLPKAPDQGPIKPVERDLVPARRINPDGSEAPGAEGFCVRNGGSLLVTVKNVGNGAAGPSVTKIVFFLGGSQVEATQNTPAIGGGQRSAPLSFTIPVGCHIPDCNFRIIVDSENDVAEGTPGGEANNAVDGICIG